MDLKAVGRLNSIAYFLPSLICAALTSAVAQERAPASFDVPRVRGIAIDGKADDWRSNGLRIEMLTPLQKELPTPGDSSAITRLGWDERGLLVLMDVRDDTTSDEALGNLLRQDTVEFYVASGLRNRYYMTISPAISNPAAGIGQQITDRRITSGLRDNAEKPVTLQSARTVHSGGYTLELLFPWKNLEITPAEGQQLLLQFVVNDADGEEAITQWAWYPQTGAQRDATRMYTIRLANHSNPPSQAVATARHERFRRVRVNVTGVPGLIGQTVSVKDANRVLASGKLSAEGGWASAELTAPMPPINKTYGPLTVWTGRNQLATVRMPDLERVRREAFEETPLVFKPSVFNTTEFPSCDFEQPSLVEDLIGPYRLKATFYNAEFNLVTKAERPGRYGAIVEVWNENGLQGKRFITLFRYTGEVNWNYGSKLATPGDFPAELGIDPQVVKDRNFNTISLLRKLVSNGLTDEPDTAMTLAGLHETKPGLVPFERTSPWSENRKWWYQLKKKTGDVLPLKYIENLPPGYDDDPNKKWPLVVFLHGIGETGDNVEIVKRTGLPELWANGKTFPFVMVSPQAPVAMWLPVQLNDFLDEMIAKYRVDTDRIYFTGLSMGGLGTWNYTLEYGDRLAAIAPMAIGGDELDVERLKNIPAWYFYGGRDNWITTSGNRLSDALRKIGANTKITFYPEATHSDTWYKGYAEPDLYDWLLSHRRSDRKLP